MASSNQFQMSDIDREFLRKNRQYLIENLNVDDVWPRMPHIFDRNSEDKITAEPTEQKKIMKFLDLLPSRGPDAFNAFIVAAYQSQEYLGKHLARMADINLNDILPVEDENSCMKKVHREVLRRYLPKFLETLDEKRMVKSLVEAKIIKSEESLQQDTRKVQVEKLILNVLPRSGPDAFNAFFDSLKRNQGQFYTDLEQLIKRSHPNIALGKCYQESSHAGDFAVATSPTYTLATPCSKLLEEALTVAAERLDPPSELLENDWKMFYKVLKLPEGKENVIAEKGGSPTRHVIKHWIDRDGKLATIKKFLEALGECDQGGLAQEMEQMLGVELPVVECHDVVDGLENMRIKTNSKAIRIVKDIPEDLKQKFVHRLQDGVEQGVLSKVATAVNEERCYVRDGADFLDKINESKTRILFRELRKADQGDIAQWMRKHFPAGSTGPMKSDDEMRAGDMNYGHRSDVTRILTAKGCWKKLASHPDVNLNGTDISLLEKRTQGSDKDPSEEVLTHWEVRSRSTAGTMYDLLVDCEFYDVADRL